MTIKAWVMSFAGVIAAVFVLQLAVMYFTDEAPGAVVLFPSEGFISSMPADMAVVGMGKGWVAVKSDGDRLGKRLYQAGARLVLPAGLPGCLPLPKTSRQNIQD